MKSAKAYSPAHITGFFMAFKNGSTGAGVNLAEGVSTKVIAKKSAWKKVSILINGKKTPAETSRKVVEKYLSAKKENWNVQVFHSTKIPIGYGLGASGAGAFSLSIALNEALGTGYSKKQVMEIAKQAEIEAGTGLGDVVAQQFHGVIIGLPPFPSTKAHLISGGNKHVVCGFFGPIKTKKVLDNKKLLKQINQAGKFCMQKIHEKKTIERFLELSGFFTLSSGLATKEVKKAMKEIPQSAQSMLGNTVFVITNSPKKVKKQMKKFCKNILVSKIAGKGARIL